MPFDIKVIQTLYSGKWKFEDMRKGSKIAALFPNDLVQGEVGFNSVVRFPIMTPPNKQDNWSSSTGFKESEAEEKTVEIRLNKNHTTYDRIAKINIPADPQTWAENKIKMINRDEAADIDDFVLNELGTTTANKLAFAKITEDNFIDAITQLEEQAAEQKFELKDAIIFISPSVATAIVKSKVQSVNLNLENVSANVKRVLDDYSVVKAGIDKYGYQMIALLPTAFSWLVGIETPLTAGEYSEGSFLGQVFVAQNHFYGGGIAQQQFVIGVTAPEESAKKQSEATTSSSLNALKTQIFDKLENQFAAFVKDNEKFKKEVRKMLAKASNYQEVKDAEGKIIHEVMGKPEEFPLSAPTDQVSEPAEDQDAESEKQE